MMGLEPIRISPVDLKSTMAAITSHVRSPLYAEIVFRRRRRSEAILSSVKKIQEYSSDGHPGYKVSLGATPP